MNIKGLTPILNVSDIVQSFEWFEKLGWQKGWDWGDPPSFGGVCNGKSEIFLCQNGQGSRGGPEPQFVGDDMTGGVWMSWWLESPAAVDEAYQLAMKHELNVTMPPTDEPWNVREFHLRHPDGHTFRVSAGLEEHNELTLRIVLRQPTRGVDFGLRRGRGSKYEVDQKQRSTGKDLEFELQVGVKSDKDGAPDFSGAFVQGARGDRYLYIGIGTYAGQSNTEWSRRLKIPLSRITWELINSGSTLVGYVPGCGKDGGPSCAYSWLKQFDPPWQWTAEETHER